MLQLKKKKKDFVPQNNSQYQSLNKSVLSRETQTFWYMFGLFIQEVGFMIVEGAKSKTNGPIWQAVNSQRGADIFVLKQNFFFL